jgi:hypothetical protein
VQEPKVEERTSRIQLLRTQVNTALVSCIRATRVPPRNPPQNRGGAAQRSRRGACW